MFICAASLAGAKSSHMTLHSTHLHWGDARRYPEEHVLTDILIECQMMTTFNLIWFIFNFLATDVSGSFISSYQLAYIIDRTPCSSVNVPVS